MPMLVSALGGLQGCRSPSRQHQTPQRGGLELGKRHDSGVTGTEFRVQSLPTNDVTTSKFLQLTQDQQRASLRASVTVSCSAHA